MELKVYNGEIYDRGLLWYVIASLIIIFLIILSFILKNYFWLLVVWLLIAWYLFLEIWSKKKINIKITDTWIIIWDKFFNRDNIVGFDIELLNTKKNLIIFTENDVLIYTIAENSEDKILDFENQLVNFIPKINLISNYVWLNIFRKLKI